MKDCVDLLAPGSIRATITIVDADGAPCAPGELLVHLVRPDGTTVPMNPTPHAGLTHVFRVISPLLVEVGRYWIVAESNGNGCDTVAEETWRVTASRAP